MKSYLLNEKLFYTNLLYVIFSAAIFMGCSTDDLALKNGSPDNAVFTVTFSGTLETEIPSQKVAPEKQATRPTDPVRDSFVFKGWLFGATPYDFGLPVTKDIVLVASWEATANTDPDAQPDPGTDPDPDPTALLPAEYVLQLGKGFDVTWSEFSKYTDLYSEQAVIDFKKAGFSNVRIRMNDEALAPQFMATLKKQVDDCIRHGIHPILSYQGHYIEENATDHADAKKHLVDWWTKMAAEFKDYPETLTFNILVEISGTYKDDYTNMNDFYVDILKGIRETNPTRIVIFPPVSISNPEYLQHLEIPGNNDPYTMAEWHLYAAGPNKKDGGKKYWVDGSTAEERQNVTGPIKTAADWMQKTGYKTWVGAWMAGNYNKGNEYDITAQVGFASFMTRELAKVNIPWSINAGNKYYDYEKKEWFNETEDAAGIPVRDAILDAEKIALYEGEVYTGNSYRLAPGNYTNAELKSLGIEQNIGSMMVPFDFEVLVYPEDNFGGTFVKYDFTVRSMDTPNMGSIKVVDKNTY